jgi:hypothetical protein
MRKMVSHAQHLLQTEKLYLDKLDLQEKVFSESTASISGGSLEDQDLGETA